MNNPRVHFSFHQVNVNLQNRGLLKLFIEQLFKNEKTKLASIQYVFCSDEFLLQLNQSYLQHDTYTDIITFDLSEGKGTLGEIYISVDRVKENAKGFNISTQQELLRVMFHGALHLCGYKDKKKTDQLLMRRMEDHYLTKFREKVSRET